MSSFIRRDDSGECLKLFREKGDLFDLDSAKEKLWKKSGCRNRFTFSQSREVSEFLPKDRLKTKEGDCFVRGDRKLLEYYMGKKIYNTTVDEKLVQSVGQLPSHFTLDQELKFWGVKPKSSLSAAREFLKNVGRGLPVPWEIVQNPIFGPHGIRALFGSKIILAVLEKEGVFFPKHTFDLPKKITGSNDYHLGKGTIAVLKDKIYLPFGFLKDSQEFKDSNARFAVLQVQVRNFTHANIIVIDKLKKTVTYFEPHGLSSAKPEYVKNPQNLIEKFIKGYKLDGYRGVYDESVCPWFGPQTLAYARYRAGYCETWSQLFVYMKVKFPELSNPQIYEVLRTPRPEDMTDLIERFAAFAWDEGQKFVDKYYPTLEDRSESSVWSIGRYPIFGSYRIIKL
ncbi:hypothetical protein GMAR_ORF148 [Golden Marseillevirus]|uniref:hypothetical protein n=1 Tax=Golden Marseillevirus TaxID=1720526 RepID=UPI000877AD6A|nr:hypothetical protein GMAR_ORF148 [Golden Marseillevirus]ALX27522.1 hypothetical protein GMAR_ORF148 [Golden Marseillevirus]